MTITNVENPSMHVHPHKGWPQRGTRPVVWPARPRHSRIYFIWEPSDVDDEFYLRSPYGTSGTYFYLHSHRGHAYRGNHLVYWPCGSSCGRRIRFRLVPLWTYRPSWFSLQSVATGFYGTQLQHCEGTEATMEITRTVSWTLEATIGSELGIAEPFTAKVTSQLKSSVTRALEYRHAFSVSRSRCDTRSFKRTEPPGSGIWLWQFRLIFRSADGRTEWVTVTSAFAQTGGAWQHPLCWAGFCGDDPHYQQCCEDHLLPFQSGKEVTCAR